MKKIFVFDVDNTIFSGQKQVVPSETIKLLQELKNKKYTLAIATGRGPAKLHVIDNVIHLFDYIITVNGALMTKDGQVLLDQQIKKEDIIDAINITEANEISLGMVSDTN